MLRRRASARSGCMCSLPKRRPKSLCCSCVIFWSRKKITRLSISASCTSWNCWLPSGLREIDAEDLRADCRASACALRSSDRPCGFLRWPRGYASPARAPGKSRQSPYCGLGVRDMAVEIVIEPSAPQLRGAVGALAAGAPRRFPCCSMRPRCRGPRCCCCCTRCSLSATPRSSRASIAIVSPTACSFLSVSIRSSTTSSTPLSAYAPLHLRSWLAALSLYLQLRRYHHPPFDRALKPDVVLKSLSQHPPLLAVSARSSLFALLLSFRLASLHPALHLLSLLLSTKLLFVPRSISSVSSFTPSPASPYSYPLHLLAFPSLSHSFHSSMLFPLSPYFLFSHLFSSSSSLSLSSHYSFPPLPFNPSHSYIILHSSPHSSPTPRRMARSRSPCSSSRRAGCGGPDAGAFMSPKSLEVSQPVPSALMPSCWMSLPSRSCSAASAVAVSAGLRGMGSI